MDIVVSGTRPTGKIHLGNYLGAIKNFVRMQDEYEQCYFFIADYHSLTTHPDAKELPVHVKRTLATYLACGLDPEKCVIYLQSDLPQIPELYLLLNMFAYKGELEKVTTFKEKIRKKGQTVNAGLLTYPVLMAADIIIHRATKVPVGKDQAQHLEMTRNFGNRFNHVTGSDFFPEPQAFNFSSELVKVPSLDGSGKMSKSDENEKNAIFLMDEDNQIKKKVNRAKSDSGPTEPNSPIADEVKHLFDLMETVSEQETLDHFKGLYADCSIRYGDMKKQLGEDIMKMVAPIRERMLEIEGNEKYLKQVTEEGGEKARASAQKTIDGVRELLGLNYF